MTDRYDVFVSHSSANIQVAQHIVERLESQGYRCFIAPRDLQTGVEYASEIIRGISCSTVVLLIFSHEADRSAYVLREINSAVSRNKTIIPLRITEIVPGEAMEFYLGATHWLDAFPEVLNTHLDKIVAIINTMTESTVVPERKVNIVGPQLLELANISQIGMDNRALLTREMEIDYLCVPMDKFDMGQEVEGSFDDWISCLGEYEQDTSILLVKDDNLIGYCDMYPVTCEAYDSLISGKQMIRQDMIDLYSLGGHYNCYIGMMAIDPQYQNQQHYMMLFGWVYNHLLQWAEQDIHIDDIGISVYNDMLEKFVRKFGFEFVGNNLAKGKIYTISASLLLDKLVILFKGK